MFYINVLSTMDIYLKSKSKYFLTFLWGLEPEYFGARPKTYSFVTRRERMCFLRGVMEADGYNVYSFIEHDVMRTFKLTDFPNWEDYNKEGGV
tara:strand:- start:9 stop:287 length:279 start_codon:yes stop_codon:yes gene_type:complete